MPPSGDRAKAVMVMVIVRLLLGQNHRLRCGPAVEGMLPGIEDDFVSGLSAQQTFANWVSICCANRVQARQEEPPIPDQLADEGAAQRPCTPFPQMRGTPRLDDRRVTSRSSP
jgi:hypothetical protein